MKFLNVFLLCLLVVGVGCTRSALKNVAKPNTNLKKMVVHNKDQCPIGIEGVYESQMTSTKLSISQKAGENLVVSYLSEDPVRSFVVDGSRVEAEGLSGVASCSDNKIVIEITGGNRHTVDRISVADGRLLYEALEPKEESRSEWLDKTTDTVTVSNEVDNTSTAY